MGSNNRIEGKVARARRRGAARGRRLAALGRARAAAPAAGARGDRDDPPRARPARRRRRRQRRAGCRSSRRCSSATAGSTCSIAATCACAPTAACPRARRAVARDRTGELLDLLRPARARPSLVRSEPHGQASPRQVALGRALLQDPRAGRRGIGKGRVAVNGQPAKASRELRDGDLIELRQARGRADRRRQGAEPPARPGAGGAGALRGDAGERRAPRAPQAPERSARPRAGAGDRAGPPDQARPPPARRLEPLERLGRPRLSRRHHGVAKYPLEIEGNAPHVDSMNAERPPPRPTTPNRPPTAAARPRQQASASPRRRAACRRPRSPPRRAVRRLPARQGRSREHPPPRRGRDRQGAQVRGRELRREPAAGEGQPGGGDRDPDADARADAAKASHATLRQLSAALERNKVVEINPAAGAKFDPHQHQAISVVPARRRSQHRGRRAAEGLPDRRPRAAPGPRHGQRARLTRPRA